MQEAYCVVWLVLLASTLALMVGLYSKVVYTLWFKRDENNQLTYQQQVSKIYFEIKYILIPLIKYQVSVTEEVLYM